jgi:formylmethanofuran dehydrogenase subunit E
MYHFSQNKTDAVNKLGPQGKMSSNFKCDKCQEQVSLEEYFTYLELKIPKARDASKLKRWGIPDMPIANPQESKQKSSGWFSGMFKQTQEQYYLYDCLVDFFETKTIRPHGNLYCEKCKDRTPYHKTYRILNLPNILCFHIRRKGLEPNENHKVESTRHLMM